MIVAEFFLATLSFVFFKMTRLFVALVFPIQHLLAKRQFEWKFATPQLFKKPLVLPLIMTTGPRWNPHAIVGTVGPIPIQESVKIDMAAVERSARVWTVTLVTFPGYKPVATLNSNAAQPVKPGKYSIAVRYYHCGSSVEFPALTVDGIERIRSASVPSTLNEVYRTLAKQQGVFYSWLHYYVWVLLRYRRYFPAAFVEREYLPSGNPETHFYFAALRSGERLALHVEPDIFNTYDVYVTIYNRASFPLDWYQVREADFKADAYAVDITCLVRVHPAKPVREKFRRDAVRLECVGQE